MGLEDIVLIVGAGGSAGSPSFLPAFIPLAGRVLRGLGWTDELHENVWEQASYGEFKSPMLMAEVLFGSLRRFGVSFSAPLIGALSGAQPNGVHHLAAKILAARGMVWTTNVDRCIEDAATPIDVHRVGRPSTTRTTAPKLGPLGDAAPGSLVKLHGTVDDPASLAFTDLELLEPLSGDVADHLAGLAAGRVIILYGYAGADADLRDLLERVFASASEIVWFEAAKKVRDDIRRAFPHSPIQLRPKEIVRDRDYGQLARLFIDELHSRGAHLEPALDSELVNGRPPASPPLTLPVSAPGIAQARLIERFGAPNAQHRAFRTAFLKDARHLRWRTIPGYARWQVTSNLYNGGIVAVGVRALADHRPVLGAIPARRLRNYTITRGCALKLRAGDWQGLHDLSDWAIGVRDDPSDYYYRAHARRYMFEIAGARADADIAAAGLSAARDPERHAGAVLEQGIVAIYQGRFEDALRFAFELRERTGRYAIPRWHDWGAWLEAIADCYLDQTVAAGIVLDEQTRRFTEEQLPGALADVQTARYLAARVKFAKQGGPAPDIDLDQVRGLSRRYLDDRTLLAADTLIGAKDYERAKEMLTAVEQSSDSCPTARYWAKLGLAEIDARRDRKEQAAEKFEQLARNGLAAEAYWFARQALDGLIDCGSASRVAELELQLPAALRGPRVTSRVGSPRVLWMMTT